MKEQFKEQLARGIGDNSGELTIRVEVRLFNSLARFGGVGGAVQLLELPVGGTVGDVISALRMPSDKVFLVLKNGRDVTRGVCGGPVNLNHVLENGDVVALSGPVPYSWGYGAPVV